MDEEALEGTPTVPEWRKEHPTAVDKLGFILDNDIFSDITFRVGKNQETILSHKLILMMSSPVFESWFQYTGSESEDVLLPEIKPEPFRAMLKYLYTGKFEVSFEIALDVLKLASKYELPQLSKECCSLLKAELNEKNAVVFLQANYTTTEAAESLGNSNLEIIKDLLAFKFILENFDKVANEKSFLNLTHENLCSLLIRDDLEASEIKIFLALCRWADASCEESGIDPIGKNIRGTLGEKLLSLIRFPLMTVPEFSLHVIPKNILTAEESLALLQYISINPLERDSLSLAFQFNKHPRVSARIFTVNFCEKMSEETYIFDYECRVGFDNFMTNKPIKILSYGFPAPNVDNADYEAEIQLTKESDPDIIIGEKKSIVSVDKNKIFHVYFEDPVPVEPNTWYTASYKLLKGPPTYWIEKRKSQVKVDCGVSDICFKFAGSFCQLIEIDFKAA